MKSVTVRGKLDSDEITKLFTSLMDQEAHKIQRSGDGSDLTILTGSRYFLRTRDNVGFCMVRYYDGISTSIDFGRVGGGSGILGIRFGAGDKLEEDLMEKIRIMVESQGMTLTYDEGSNTDTS